MTDTTETRPDATQADETTPAPATTPDADALAAQTDAADPDADAQDEGADAGDATNANREAAKYRRRLRDAEAQIAGMAERLAVVQRGEAERIAADHLTDGADLWRDGATLDALLDDNGNVDAGKVAELAAATAAAHPHWTRPPQPKPIQRGGGLKSGATNSNEQSTPTWASVLRQTSR